MWKRTWRQKVFRGERKSRPQPQAEPKKLNGTSRLQPRTLEVPNKQAESYKHTT